MKVIIQLRGINASGKSTSVRQFIAKNGLKPTYVQIGDKITKIEANKYCAVIGWYQPDSNAEGCDAHLDNKEHLKAVLQELMKRQYRVIVFEGLIYGLTFDLATVINKIARFYGYKYKPLLLYCEYTKNLDRLFVRNGGNTNIDLDNFDLKRDRAKIASDKLQKAGISVKLIDTTKIKKEEMYKIIQEVCIEAGERTVE